MIVAGKNLRFLVEKHFKEASDFDKLMNWARGTTSRLQLDEYKAPRLDKCTQIIEHFGISLDTFLYVNLENKIDNLEKLDTVQESNALYKKHDTEGVGMKIDLIETERQLYERIIATKDELIAYLKKEIERHEAEKRGDSTV